MKTSSRYFFTLNYLFPNVLLLAILSSPVQAIESLTVLMNPAILSTKSIRQPMLAISHAGTRLVAVGSRGIILLSDDNGSTWRQAKVPVSTTLTCVQFIDQSHGWAAGHMGVLLHSNDGGETWEKRLDGNQVAALIYQQAQQRLLGNADDPLAAKAMDNAQRLLDDGPDKPFLSLFFQDNQRGYLLGAYNLIMRTSDGGNSWQPWQEHLDNPGENHLYAMQRIGDAIFIAGEQGLLLRSKDGGERFERLASPYEGSFFGLLATSDGAAIAYGLRGHAFRSIDGGDNWSAINTGSELGISDAIQLRDGRLVLVDQGGQLLLSGADAIFAPFSQAPAPLTGVAQGSDGRLIGSSLAGVLPLNAPKE